VIRGLLVAILILLLAHAFWRVVGGIIEAAGGTSRRSRVRGGKPPVKLAKDPVCGTWVAPKPELTASRGGETFFFCSEACRGEFQRKQRV
jgi:YHS domain-containing protein